MTFGKKLKLLRQHKMHSQQELADTLCHKYDCMITRDDIANWETGRHHPKWPHALLISRYFRVTLDDLFFENKTEFFKPIKRQVLQKLN